MRIDLVVCAHNHAIKKNVNRFKRWSLHTSTQKHGQIWKLISEITGRETSSKGPLKGDTQSEQVANQYKHFKSLLVNTTVIHNEDEQIASILDELNFRTYAFDQDEYNAAKRSLVLWKAKAVVRLG